MQNDNEQSVNVIEKGYCGENIKYKLDDTGLLTIYLGDKKDNRTMYNYKYNHISPFYGRTDIFSVSIDDDITHIGDYAFAECSELKNVTLGNNLWHIGKKAFFNCCSLTNIVIPKKVSTIEDEAFSNCSNLKSINIPDYINDIGYEAFYKCRHLENIIMPRGLLHYIREDIFFGCDELTNITLQ